MESVSDINAGLAMGDGEGGSQHSVMASSVNTNTAASVCSEMDYTDIATSRTQQYDILPNESQKFQTWHGKQGRMATGTYRPDDLHINHLSDFIPNLYNIFNYTCTQIDSDGTTPIKIKTAVFTVQENMKNHRTLLYDRQVTIDGVNTKLLVARRGQPFFIYFTLDQAFDRAKHNLIILIQFGDKSEDPHSMIRVETRKGVHRLHWSAGLDEVDGSQLRVQLHIPADAIVGRTRLTFDLVSPKNAPSEPRVKEEGADKEGEVERADELIIMRYQHPDFLYVIFNPSCTEDETYTANQSLIDDFLIPENGLLYVGVHEQIESVPWSYAQYRIEVLETAIKLMDASHLAYEARNSPTSVIKSITNSVCSVEDKGLMTSNWSGRYKEGRAPSQWQSTQTIVDEFNHFKRPVLYGQCYVFSAVAISFFRTLGIVSRCVTNFSSGHDGDGSASLVLHWSSDGRPIDDLNTKAFWCFHSWCEVYLHVQGETESNKGWHAVDPTPQLTSYGMVCAGPCPVAAIKEGDTMSSFDTRLFFVKLNNHQLHRILQQDGSWRDSVQPFFTGKKIVTFNPRQPPILEEEICQMKNRDAILEIMDITSNYKHSPGSVSASKAIFRANLNSTHSKVFDDGTGDVRFAICEKTTFAGQPIDVNLRMTNQTAEERMVQATLSLVSVYYTGLTKYRVKTEKFIVRLCPAQTRTVTMRALSEDYCYYMSDLSCFKIYAFAFVPLTDQLFVTCEDFRVISEPLEIVVEKDGMVGKLMTMVAHWRNSLPIRLTGGIWTIEAAGLIKNLTINNKELEPMEDAHLRYNFKAMAAGAFKVKVSFRSTEFTGVRAVTVVFVADKPKLI